MFFESAKSIEERKDLVDDQVALYLVEKKLEADREMLDYTKDHRGFLEQIAKDEAENAYAYHKGIEEKTTKLAKLDAKIEEREKFLKENQALRDRIAELHVARNTWAVNRMEEVLTKILNKKEPEIKVIPTTLLHGHK